MYIPLGVAHLLGEAEEAAHGIRTGGEDKHEGDRVGHVFIEGGQSHWWTLHKLWAEVTGYKVDCGKHNLRRNRETYSIIHLHF